MSANSEVNPLGSDRSTQYKPVRVYKSNSTAVRDDKNSGRLLGRMVFALENGSSDQVDKFVETVWLSLAPLVEERIQTVLATEGASHKPAFESLRQESGNNILLNPLDLADALPPPNDNGKNNSEVSAKNPEASKIPSEEPGYFSRFCKLTGISWLTEKVWGVLCFILSLGGLISFR
ncbi:MAG: hypothetical protein AAGF04_00075 [Chlamydiota bacterium]